MLHIIMYSWESTLKPKTHQSPSGAIIVSHLSDLYLIPFTTCCKS